MFCEAVRPLAVDSPALTSSHMRLPASWSALLAILLAGALIGGSLGPGRAEGDHSFVIATDGYGVQDCLAESGECGRVVADAWCEAHGQGHARSYGLSDDVTGAIATSARPVKSQGAYFITCGD